MRKIGLGFTALLMVLMLAFVTAPVSAGGPAPAVPLDQKDVEDIFVASFTIKVKPVTVEIVQWPEGEIKSGQTFTITAVAKNHRNQDEEIIYYLDYPETPTPLLSGTVTIDYDGKGPQQPEVGYKWGTKVKIGPGAEQILYISLSPAPWFPSQTSNGDLRLGLRVVRWLGLHG